MESTLRRRRGGGMFSCLRPDSVDDDPSVERTIPSLLARVEVGGQPNVAVSGAKLPAEYSEGDGRRKGSFCRRLSRALKTVLLETSSLTKKNRDKRSRKTSFRPTSSLFADREQIEKVTDDKNLDEESFGTDDLLRIDSSRSSHISSSTGVSSSPSSSSSSNSRSSSQRKSSFQADSTETKGSFQPNSFEFRNQNSTKNGGFHNSTIGVCLLLEVLMALLLWGKICAILCTSMWLFCFSRRCINRLGRSVDLPGLESPEYKKRVIMEGLLRRSQSRRQ